MAKSLATLKEGVKSRLEPETSAPTFNSIHNDQWARWATGLAQKVVAYFYEKDKRQIQALLTIDKSLTVTSGVASLVGVTDFAFVECFKVTTSKRDVELLNEKEFAMWDSRNFAFTPNANWPLGIVSGDKVTIKPTTDTSGNAITTGYLDYFKKHPDIDGSNGSVFSAIADDMLEELLFKRVVESIEEVEV